VPVNAADAAAVRGGAPAGMAHQFIDDAGGDTRILQPSCERVAQVVWTVQV
jgi:hypothetical protein